MKKMLKRLLFSILALALLFTNLAAPSLVSAQSPSPAPVQGTWYNQSFQQWYTKVYDNSNPSEIFGERYSAAQVQWIIYSLFAFAINATGDPETTTCLMNNDLNDCVDAVNDLFSFAPEYSKYFAERKNEGVFSFFLEDRPLSGISYFKDVARNLKIIPEAKAQSAGFGFEALNPVLPLWRASRNVAYTIFAIVLLAFAFMIMFRVKISPQTVISVQSALPKIATALILVTFSYAIAGLLIDFMYVVIALLSLVFTPVSLSPTTVFNLLTQGPFGLGFTGFIAFYFVFSVLTTFIVLFGANGLVGAVVGVFTGFTWVMILLALIITLVLIFVLFFIAIKIGWMLLKAFVNIMLLTILAPLQMALGAAIPGMGLGGWLRSMLSNLAVFPTTGVMIILSFLFLLFAANQIWENLLPDSISQFFIDVGFSIPGVQIISAATTQQGWPPLLVFGIKNSMALVFLGASFVIMFIIPKINDMIKSMIEGRPFAFGTAVGEAFAPISAAQRMVTGSPAYRAFSEYYGARQAATILRSKPAKKVADAFGLGAGREDLAERLGTKGGG